MTKNLKEHTVQDTLCIPLCGRMLATEQYPNFFPDNDAKRIIKNIGCDISDKKIFKNKYFGISCLIRQYNLAWEINHYLKTHKNATVVELGAGLSTLRCQMNNETNPWYNLDMKEVIELREQHIPKGPNEKNVVCDLNDISWFEKIEFCHENGIVFVAGGLFYYFEKKQVKALFTAMAKKFSGGMIAFDATNKLGLRAVNKEVKMAGNQTKSFFSLENPKLELERWSSNIFHVTEKDYMTGYPKKEVVTGVFNKCIVRLTKKLHMSFIVHAEFKK